MTVLNQADAIFLGADAVDAVYLGAEKVWPEEGPPPLTYSQAVLNENPFAYYQLHGDTNDSSPNNRHATVGNGTWGQGPFGPGTAYVFNGTVAGSIALPTVSAPGWVPVGAELTAMYWRLMQAAANTGQVGWQIGIAGSGVADPNRLQVYDPWGLTSNLNFYYGSEAAHVITAPSPPPFGTWAHITMVATTDELVIYINGSEANRVTRPSGSRPTSAFTGGALGRSGVNQFPASGAISNWAFWQRALSSTTIAGIYAARLTT